MSIEHTRPSGSGSNGPEFLFDVGRSAETEFCPRSKRDSWYEPRLKAQVTAWSNGNAVLQGVDKRLGSANFNISSRDYGVGARELEQYTRRTKAPVEFEASPHSRRSILDQQVCFGFLILPLHIAALWHIVRAGRVFVRRRIACSCVTSVTSMQGVTEKGLTMWILKQNTFCLCAQLNRATGALLPPFNGNSNSAAGPPGSTLNL